MTESGNFYVDKDGHLQPNTPLGWQGGIDFEVTGHGPYEWSAWDEDMCVGKGAVRTKLGLMIALWWARKGLRA
jgi:hypothetical protein